MYRPIVTNISTPVEPQVNVAGSVALFSYAQKLALLLLLVNILHLCLKEETLS